MKRHHKWFRKERYKLKLERSVDKHKTYYSNIYFITKEPDPAYINRRWNQHWASWWTEEKKWEYLTKPAHGKDYYIYYDRPEVDYSIQYYRKPTRRSKRQKDIKKRTNKRIRQDWKQYGEVYQHNSYRKATEFWWEMD